MVQSNTFRWGTQRSQITGDIEAEGMVQLNMKLVYSIYNAESLSTWFSFCIWESFGEEMLIH